MVDGKPFIIKAVCYNPTPKGESNNWNKHSSLTYKLEPTQHDLEIIENDFKLMHEAGINTIRVYKPITNREILKKLDFYNLKVIVPVFTNYKGRHHPYYVRKMEKVVRQLKDEKSTLFWEIGNEWNYNFFYAKDKSSTTSTDSVSREEAIAKCIKYLNFAIDIVKEIDTVHPISTCLGDIPFKVRPDNTLDVEDLNIEDFWKLLPNDKIDIYGVNIYDGKTFNATWDQPKGEGGWERVPSRFERWKKITQPVNEGGIGPKPLYISEFGATAYNLAKHGVPPHADYQTLKNIILAIDDYFLKGILPTTPFFIKKLAPDYCDEQGVPHYADPFKVTINIEPDHIKPDIKASMGKIHNYSPAKDQDYFGGVDEEAQAEGVSALANEIHENLSAINLDNFLLGGAVFEFCDEWWKTPDLSPNILTDPSVHSIRGFADTDSSNMICGGPWPDGYFHEEWFGLCTIDRIPRKAYSELKEIYTADDDNGHPTGVVSKSNK
ncbi:MAG: hypothetical protein K2W99_00295 [Chthoniobacterales bacterium]|nr:hypothetical protein [Chthoniobacterales bacterium]